MSNTVFDRLKDNYQLLPAGNGIDHEHTIGKNLQNALQEKLPPPPVKHEAVLPASSSAASSNIKPKNVLSETKPTHQDMPRHEPTSGDPTKAATAKPKAKKGKTAKAKSSATESATLVAAGDAHKLEDGIEGYMSNMGFFRRYPKGSATSHTNSSNRPQIRVDPAEITANFHGQMVHPAVLDSLTAFMDALHQAGDEMDDASLKNARVASAFRAVDTAEGGRYLSALQKTIMENKSIFGTLTFPAALEEMAKTDMHEKAARKAFKEAIAASPGWNASLTTQLLTITSGYKASSGGSTHHSGVVVDIDFPYVHLKGGKAIVKWHQITRKNNAEALQSAAGVWLSQNSTKFQFDTYNTDKEIWHHEWLAWKGPLAKARRI
jgi:hypothetical protein